MSSLFILIICICPRRRLLLLLALLAGAATVPVPLATPLLLWQILLFRELRVLSKRRRRAGLNGAVISPSRSCSCHDDGFENMFSFPFAQIPVQVNQETSRLCRVKQDVQKRSVSSVVQNATKFSYNTYFEVPSHKVFVC